MFNSGNEMERETAQQQQPRQKQAQQGKTGIVDILQRRVLLSFVCDLHFGEFHTQARNANPIIDRQSNVSIWLVCLGAILIISTSPRTIYPPQVPTSLSFLSTLPVPFVLFRRPLMPFSLVWPYMCTNVYDKC